MKKTLRCALILMASLLAALPIPAQARKAESAPIRKSVIVSPVNARDVRLLLLFELPKEMLEENAIVDFATLHLPARLSDAAMAQIDVAGLATAWKTASSVSWSEPWSEPGGDIAAEVAPSIYSLKSEGGSRDMAIDVTELVRAWKSGEVANNGLILTISKADLEIDRPKVAFDGDKVMLRIFYSCEKR